MEDIFGPYFVLFKHLHQMGRYKPISMHTLVVMLRAMKICLWLKRVTLSKLLAILRKEFKAFPNLASAVALFVSRVRFGLVMLSWKNLRVETGGQADEDLLVPIHPWLVANLEPDPVMIYYCHVMVLLRCDY